MCLLLYDIAIYNALLLLYLLLLFVQCSFNIKMVGNRGSFGSKGSIFRFNSIEIGIFATKDC